MIDISIWGDFACPFCYMEETRLRLVMSGLGLTDNDVRLHFHAYELDPDAPKVPAQTMQQHFESAHHMTPQEALADMQHICRLASHVGLNYNLTDTKVCSTFDAHRLMKYCEAHSDYPTTLRLNFELFKTNFIDNLPLADHDVLLKVAQTVGLDKNGVSALLEGTDYTSQVREDEKAADGFDLEYIPYMVFPDGKVLQGVISNGAFKNALSPK
ncbi:MAG: DsbA family oxidoreductase [Muribaculum sp.]|nr:DsbA family oxidoreductase [Muribaculum sp.]